MKTEEYKGVEDKKISLSFEVLVSVLRSITKSRLVETENPSACATVDWGVCKSVIELY
jgi:hypothetical protein